MLDICRKKPLARNLAAMAEAAPEEYGDLLPKTFQLPEQQAALAAELAANCGAPPVRHRSRRLFACCLRVIPHLRCK